MLVKTGLVHSLITKDYTVNQLERACGIKRSWKKICSVLILLGEFPLNGKIRKFLNTNA